MVSRISASPLSCTVNALIAFLNVSSSVFVAASSDRLRRVLGLSRSYRPVKQLVLNKHLDLAMQHVVAADQPQVLHHGLREVADHAAIIGNARRVEDGGMRHLAGGDVLEDNLSLLCFAKL